MSLGCDTIVQHAKQSRKLSGKTMPEKRWGNPYLVGKHGDAAACIAQFRAELVSSPTKVAEAQRDLGGKNLACWCKPGEPCHADVLIEIANSVRSG